MRARDIVCYWSAVELGISMADLAKKHDMTLAAVSYAVKQGEKIAQEERCKLED
ncbi:hypothetical protein PITCH_A1820001 [uncultured Desulfobacterium sp.]|uniref:Uncharacterized protein n=1 Tax=uncultured Desulfobacterium sp. TaxID=201089 RepID=A0A445MVF3_9BACT|nr:hypothetical protein PITCH_A1820001 [uncultured Desulfobacterium sp.]